MLDSLAVRCCSALTRHAADFPGRWRVVRWLERHRAAVGRLRPGVYAFAQHVRLNLDPHDAGAQELLIHGLDPRDRIARVLRAVLAPGDCMLDVGANLGAYTFVAAKLVTPAGCVHAFEASPAIADRLRDNLALSRLSHVTLHQRAVSDRAGTLTFHTADAAHTGVSSLRTLGDATARTDRVEALALDDLLDTLPTVRMVKIDVEGAEGLVLAGMRRLIQRDHPVILLELTDAWLRELNSSAAAVCDTLRDHGYHVGRLAARAIEPLDHAPTEQTNLVASTTLLTLAN